MDRLAFKDKLIGLIQNIDQAYPVELAYLFGSYAKGTDHNESDIDVVSLSKASPLLKYEIIRESIILKDSIRRGSFESLALREYFDFRYYSEIYNQAMLKRLTKGTYFGGDAGGK